MEGPSVGSAGNAQASRERVEIFCYLACMGAEAFESRTAHSLLPGRAPQVDNLLDPSRRHEISAEIGNALAESLANRGRETTWAVGALLPALLGVDTGLGFTVLQNVAAAAPAALTREFGEVLMSLTLGEAARAFRRTDATPAERVDSQARLRYLVHLLGDLDQDGASRARQFLALSQGLSDPDLRRVMVLSSMFPAEPVESAPVLLEGNDDALKAFVDGATTRPQGKAEFYRACKAVMEGGLRQGLATLGRLDRHLLAPDPVVRALRSMVRASVLVALEGATSRAKDFRTLLPEKADQACLRLLTVVAPGVKEPNRSFLCEWVVGQATTLLRTKGLVHALDPEALTEVLVGAAVLHRDPESLGGEVRRALVEVGGAIRVRLQTAAAVDEAAREAAAFERIVARVGTEFRRREHLASSLSGVLPLLSSLSAPLDASQIAAWAD